jgi:hypothetical protein
MVLTFTGCEINNKPTAQFTASKTTVKPYEEIQFTNSSHNADEYEWSFGDGIYSTDVHPYHYYTSPGTYEVKLSAFTEDYQSDAYMTIEVLAPSLDIQVLNYDDVKTPVVNAKVTLYSTFPDWQNQANVVDLGYTNTDGVVQFFNLNEGFYYLDIYNTVYDNYDLGLSDSRYITTPYIGGSTTYMTALADYIGATGQSSRVKSTKIKVYRPYDPEISKRKGK